MKGGKRTPEEDAARSLARSFCLRRGAKIYKLDHDTIAITECVLWPQGIITAFHGWQDVLNRLEMADQEPELVTDGYLVLEKTDA